MSTQSASPNNGPVTAQNAGTTDIPTLMANATRTFAALPPAIMELGTIFDEAGEELALVGGPVRDAFLGVTPHDFDMTTSARPERTEELLATWGNATWDIGKEFGDRDHTTVLHSLDQVEKKMRSDPAYAEKVKEITTNINNKK